MSRDGLKVTTLLLTKLLTGYYFGRVIKPHRHQAMMYSVVVNLRSPKDWRLKVQEFVARLEDRFDGRLLLLVALPSPSDLLYDSNVLVVLDDIRPGDLEAVVSLAPEDVNPLVVPSGDRDAIDAFLLKGGLRIGHKG
ncbi:MAG: hypothetical protein J7J65_05550 [Candidatus Korarchaeota archaeon]|nr:hypothetical protein [Candidatus Korarchaeota archaeon]